MTSMVGHGGGCCGARHFYNFYSTDHYAIEDLKKFISSLVDPRNIEIILNENQCKNSPKTLVWMHRAGFMLVGRFYNGNTGNICYIFHRQGIRYPLNNLPFKWPSDAIVDKNETEIIRLEQTTLDHFYTTPPKEEVLPVTRVRITKEGSKFYSQELPISVVDTEKASLTLFSKTSGRDLKYKFESTDYEKRLANPQIKKTSGVISLNKFWDSPPIIGKEGGKTAKEVLEVSNPFSAAHVNNYTEGN